MKLLGLLIITWLSAVTGKPPTLNGVAYLIRKPTRGFTYEKAKQKCAKKNATLADVKTEEIYDFLLKHLKPKSYPSSFYIGAKRIGKFLFRWSDGSKFNDSFPLWFEGEPDNQNGSENCVTMGDENTSKQKFQFRDVPCYTKTNFICQRILTKTAAKTKNTPGDKTKLNTKVISPKPTPKPKRTTTTATLQQSTIAKTTTTTNTPKKVTQPPGNTANQDKPITSTPILKSPFETAPDPITELSRAIHNTLSESTTESNFTIIIVVSAVGSCVIFIVVCIIIAFVISKRRQKKRLRQRKELNELENVFDAADSFESDETYGNPVLRSIRVQEQPVTPSAAQENGNAVETNANQSLEKQNDPYSLASDVTPANNDVYSVVNKKQQATNADQYHLVTVAAEIYSTPHHSQNSQDVYNRGSRIDGQPKVQDELENTEDIADACGQLNFKKSESNNPYNVLSTFV